MASARTTSPKPAATGPVHLLYGEEEYLVATKSKELVESLCPPADQAFGLELIEGRVDTVAEAVAAIRRCVEALQTMGFLGGGKVVWLRDVTFFGKGVVGESADVKAAVDELTKLIKAGLPAGQKLVVSAVKVDGRSAFFKACQAAGPVQEFGIPDKLYQVEQQARQRAGEAFREAGLKLGGDTLNAFLEKVGFDTRQILNEVEKLAVYLGERKEVRTEDVQAIVSSSREAEAWDLADAVGNRNLPAALTILRQLAFQGENPIGMMFGLENRFRDLILYREALDRKWLRVSGEAPWLKVEWLARPEVDAFASSLPKDPRPVNPFRAGKLVEQARKFSAAELRRAQKRVIEAHEEFVTASTPKELLIEFLVLRLLGPRAGKAPAPAAAR